MMQSGNENESEGCRAGNNFQVEDLASCRSETTDVGQLATSPPLSQSGAI